MMEHEAQHAHEAHAHAHAHAHELDLGAKIEAMRVARKWSQTELAKRAGVCRATIVRLEGGSGDPAIGTVAKVAGALGLSLSQLVELDQDAAEQLDVKVLCADLIDLAARAGKLVIEPDITTELATG